MKFIRFTFTFLILMQVACVPPRMTSSAGHIQAVPEAHDRQGIPDPVSDFPALPPPQTHAIEETFTVVVSNVPLKEMLFALARDAHIDIDVDPGITGRVTLTAINQPLTRILQRLSRQAEIRYKLTDDLLIVSPDLPYFKHYNIPYLNMTRNTTGNVAISTQIAATGTGDSDDATGVGNNSSTEIVNVSNNQFWPTLISNVQALIRGGDSSPFQTQGNSATNNSESDTDEGTSVIASPETNMLTVKATAKQHAVVQRYVTHLLEHARRQVLIEATVVEVELSDQYEGGVDWEVVADQARYQATQAFLGPAVLATEPFFSATYTGGDVSATVRLLDVFGNVKVLSSPKLMVLNNQTAVLKVVDNRVYFTTSVDTNLTQGVSVTTFETILHTVPVGFVMSVTPQIGGHEKIIINTRPTISRIIDFVDDPNPALALAGVTSQIPEIQVREMESVLKISNGDTGIIGGLMQDVIDESTSGLPLLARIPYVGDLFSVRDNDYIKTELIIFIRPKIIKTASLESDLSDFNQFLDDALDPEYPRAFTP